MWYMAPNRAFMATKIPVMEYPIQTQIQACHHDKPATIMDEEIIHVLMLNESAIQKPTKFQARHCRRSFSTGLRSWLVSWRPC